MDFFLPESPFQGEKDSQLPAFKFQGDFSPPICAMVKSRYIGDGHPTFNRNPYNGYIKPYYWVDDHPLLYGNNGSLDPGTFFAVFRRPRVAARPFRAPRRRYGCAAVSRRSHVAPGHIWMQEMP